MAGIPGGALMNFRPIAHPERLEEAERRIRTSFKLYREGKLPQGIAGFMLEVPLKSALRAIYGSNRRIIASFFETFWKDWRAYWIERPLRWFIYSLPWAFAWLCQREPVRCGCGWGGARRRTIHNECPICTDEL
jgi:hypothetical protein